MKKPQLKQLIHKHTNDIISSQEEAQLLEFLRCQDDLSDLRDLMIADWDSPAVEVTMDAAKADEVFTAITTSQKPAPFKVSLVWMCSAAAIFLFFLAAVYLINSTKLFAPQRTIGGLDASAVTTLQHRKVSLPDGSTVILNDNSILEYPKVFSGKSREVVLRGEGYFDIKHDPMRPFVVQSEGLTTIVLGTAFNIRALKGTPIVVTVTRGKVKVQEDDNLLAVLLPNQQLVFDQKVGTPRKFEVIADKAVAWQKNDLFFDDVTMEQAVAILNKKFNVKIFFEQEQGKKCRFTAAFLNDQNLDEILNVITAFNNASFKRAGDIITIIGTDCENEPSNK
ncbi:FecR family protein [Pedobacter deserti]|uniref:FecR family protein n=1 Tax=Pedobacter deserti TaxID=2817382 RepID=UPI0021086CC0|nr:FecR family protein [Pedobacter sp. SYSU D00382]